MKNLIKELKYNRLPKEVHLLIEILNGTKTYNTDGSVSLYYSLYQIFDIMENNIIIMYGYNMLSLFNIYPKTRQEQSQYYKIYKEYVKLALPNTVYKNYEIFN